MKNITFASLFFKLGSVFTTLAASVLLGTSSSFAQAPPNQVLSLDGNGDYVTIPSAADLQNPTAITIETWLHPTRTPNNQFGSFINKGDGAGGTSARSYEARWLYDGTITFNLFFDVVSSEPNGATLSAHMPANAWGHVAMTFDSKKGLFQLFTNGVLAAQAADFKGRRIRQTTLPLVLGWTPSYPNIYGSGFMDETRIWNTARSALEIAANVYSLLSGTEANLAGYWNFDGGTVNDLTGHEHSGTLAGNTSIVPLSGNEIMYGGGSASPILASQPRSQTAKIGSAVRFSVDVVAAIPLSYQWKKDGKDIAGATASNFSIPSAAIPDTGSYQVIVSNAAGTVTSQSAALVVNETGFTTLTVSRTSSSGPGSLPVIINQANATPGDVVVEFAVTGTITLAAPLPVITNNVTITGPLEKSVTISGGGGVSLFTFAAGTTNIVHRLVLSDGKTASNGAAINNAGTLFVTHCSFRNHISAGSAVENSGVMAIASSEFVSNKGGFGGAIHNAGVMQVAMSTLISNQAGNGGAIANEGTLSLTDSTLASNSAQPGVGGAIYSSANLSLTGVLFATNSAVSADGIGGGFGGALSVHGGDIRAVNSTFSANTAVGGGGGAAFVRDGTAMLINCTIASNHALAGPFGPGTPFPGQGIGGGVYNYRGTVGILNTIVAGNTAAIPNSDLSGAFNSTGFNLIGDNRGASGLSVNDFQNVSASLGPLQDNGGPTMTHALSQGSLAIEAGTGQGAPATDQRGAVRPLDHVDIGAFQVVTRITPAITWNAPTDITVGTPLGTTQLSASSSVSGTFTYSPPSGTVLPAGSNQVLTVIFTPTDLINFAPATSSVSINVLRAKQIILFDPLPDRHQGDPPVFLSATASSGLPVTLTVLAGPAIIVGNLLTLSGQTGPVTLRAIQAGNGFFSPAPDLERTFNVVRALSPAIVEQPGSQTVTDGDRVVLKVTAQGPELTYQWQFQQANLLGERASTLILNAVSQAQAGAYRVIVSNASGSTTSEAAVLTVRPRVSIRQVGGQVSLSWGFGTLQTSPDLQTWSDVSGAASGHALLPTEPRRFYRVRE